LRVLSFWFTIESWESPSAPENSDGWNSDPRICRHGVVLSDLDGSITFGKRDESLWIQAAMAGCGDIVPQIYKSHTKEKTMMLENS
jgi:hypothetical protein